MCTNNQNSCNDYSLLTALTNVGSVQNPNPSLAGAGDVTKIFAAGENGAVVKSVIIKAIEPVTTGMVRLFIQNLDGDNFLFKEIPVPVTPTQTNTPIPAPVLPMFELSLNAEMQLKTGYSIAASTQVANKFNVIVEGWQWTYPATLPDTCCNYKQTAAVTGCYVIADANPNLDGTGAIKPVLVAPDSENGTLVKCITIKAAQSTSINGMIRLFISTDGRGTYNLMREIPVPQTIQSAYEPSWKHIIEMNYNLAPNAIIGASTQNGEMFIVTIEGESWSYPIA